MKVVVVENRERVGWVLCAIIKLWYLDGESKPGSVSLGKEKPERK